MRVLLLLIFLALVFSLIVKFTTAVTAIIAIIIGTTTVTVLACVWLGTSYYLKKSGYAEDTAQQVYRQVDSDLKQIVGDLQEIRLQLDNVAPYLREMEFLKYARQNRESKKNRK